MIQSPAASVLPPERPHLGPFKRHIPPARINLQAGVFKVITVKEFFRRTSLLVPAHPCAAELIKLVVEVIASQDASLTAAKGRPV